MCLFTSQRIRRSFTQLAVSVVTWHFKIFSEFTRMISIVTWYIVASSAEFRWRRNNAIFIVYLLLSHGKAPRLKVTEVYRNLYWNVTKFRALVARPRAKLSYTSVLYGDQWLSWSKRAGFLGEHHARACSYEPGLVGSSPEKDELFLCSYDCFYPT